MDELKENDPDLAAKIELQTVLGIGAKFAAELVDNYDIHSVRELRNTKKSNKIPLTKMQEIGLKYYNSLRERIPRSEIKKYLDNKGKTYKNTESNVHSNATTYFSACN